MATVTDLYAAGKPKAHGWQRRAIGPLALVTASVIVGGSLRQNAPHAQSAAYAEPTPVVMPASTPTPPPAIGLSQDDPRLGMNVLVGRPLVQGFSPALQVLPNGNVPGASAASPSADAGKVSPTTQTRWARSSAPTTLWSGPDSGAAAFTDVPEGSFFRITGPNKSGRIPVYYVGDGLFRMAGDGWVEQDAVIIVEAPAPGTVPAVDADARTPLPVWVQAHRATQLWSGPDDSAVTLTDLPQWTFLKVAGVERSGRILVNYAGDYASRQPGIGWVDQSAVGPAGDPGVWVTNHRATALWSGVDANALKFTDLPQWTKLRVVPSAPGDPKRMEIEFFGDGFARQPGTAWIELADIGPITPPVPLPADHAPTATSANVQTQHQTFGSDSDFIAAVGAAAQASRKTTGVPASVTVAQAILESDWGRSRLTRQGNNLFGIKALNGPGPDGVVSLATWEHTSDGDVIVQAAFKAYQTLEQSISDHGQFFTRNHRYAAALAVANDARAFAQAIQDAGYATDPSYATKLIRLMDKYNLYRFDS